MTRKYTAETLLKSHREGEHDTHVVYNPGLKEVELIQYMPGETGRNVVILSLEEFGLINRELRERVRL